MTDRTTATYIILFRPVLSVLSVLSTPASFSHFTASSYSASFLEFTKSKLLAVVMAADRHSAAAATHPHPHLQSSEDFFAPRHASSSSAGQTPPPEYASHPPTPPRNNGKATTAVTPEPSPSASTSPPELGLGMTPSFAVVHAAQTSACSTCAHLNLQVHLLKLQNEAYQAQRDFLLRENPAASSGGEDQGLVSYLVATYVRFVFVVALLVWPYVVLVVGRVRRLGVGQRALEGVRKVWVAERRRGVGEWERVVKSGVEEFVDGVGRGMREGLEIWAK